MRPGSNTTPHLDPKRSRFSFPIQAQLYFQWINYAVRQCPDDKSVLFVNMDESSVAYTYPCQRGVVLRKRDHVGDPTAFKEKSTLGDRRGAITYLACICSDEELQSSMPQFFIGNKHRFTVALLKVLRHTTPANTHVWREDSGWMDQAKMARALKVLAESLKPVLKHRQVILILDHASAHVSAKLVNLACRLGLWVVYVPAKLTWLLQPLDTHCFANFKQSLKQKHTKLRLTTEHGDVSSKQWMDLLFEAMLEDVRGKAWRHAFESTGYIDCQRWINQGVREHTFQGAFGPLPASMPSAKDVQYMSPKHKRMPYLQLMRPLEQRATGALSHTVAIKLFPISSRTRARAKRRAPNTLPEPALASIAGPCPGAASSSSSSSWMPAALMPAPGAKPPRPAPMVMVRRCPSASTMPPPPRPPAMTVHPKSRATALDATAAPLPPPPLPPAAIPKPLTVPKLHRLPRSPKVGAKAKETTR